ncbi:hypothetical protein QUF80_03860 [Desulfococcaceae bacterium HSG8]|nr:hypothetical protein [Desulfococcaceae bacterium HSG8]
MPTNIIKIDIIKIIKFWVIPQTSEVLVITGPAENPETSEVFGEEVPGDRQTSEVLMITGPAENPETSEVFGEEVPSDRQTSEVLVITEPAENPETSEVFGEEVPGDPPDLRGFDDKRVC